MNRRETTFPSPGFDTLLPGLYPPEKWDDPCGSANPAAIPYASPASKMVSFFGPCAPSTRMRSISPVRLGPVTKDMKLG